MSTVSRVFQKRLFHILKGSIECQFSTHLKKRQAEKLGNSKMTLRIHFFFLCRQNHLEPRQLSFGLIRRGAVLLCCLTRFHKPTSLLMVCSVARQINRREVRYWRAETYLGSINRPLCSRDRILRRGQQPNLEPSWALTLFAAWLLRTNGRMRTHGSSRCSLVSCILIIYVTGCRVAMV